MKDDLKCKIIDISYINKLEDHFEKVTLSFVDDSYLIITDKVYILIPKSSVQKLRFTLEEN